MGDEPVKGGSPQENKTKSFAFQVLSLIHI